MKRKMVKPNHKTLNICAAEMIMRQIDDPWILERAPKKKRKKKNNEQTIP